MSERKHTPGPWHRNVKPARKYPTIFAGRNTHVAAVVAGAPRGSGNGETMSDEEMEANCNLIAAAPEMLEALDEARAVASLLIGSEPLIAKIDAAISKATGEPVEMREAI